MASKPPKAGSAKGATDGAANGPKAADTKLPIALQERLDAMDDPSRAPGAFALTPSAEKTAVALSYEIGGQTLPKVVATGRGKLAEDIVRLAFEAGVKVREDRDLAQLLVALDLDTEIPTEALEAVAEILAYVYQANGKMAEMREAAAAHNAALADEEAAEKPLATPYRPPAPEQPTNNQPVTGQKPDGEQA